MDEGTIQTLADLADLFGLDSDIDIDTLRGEIIA